MHDIIEGYDHGSGPDGLVIKLLTATVDHEHLYRLAVDLPEIMSEWCDPDRADCIEDGVSTAVELTRPEPSDAEMQASMVHITELRAEAASLRAMSPSVAASVSPLPATEVVIACFYI